MLEVIAIRKKIMPVVGGKMFCLAYGLVLLMSCLVLLPFEEPSHLSLPAMQLTWFVILYTLAILNYIP